MKYLKLLILLLIFINLILASRWVFDGNLFFHTDIARDFLLIEDIVDNRHFTLIGPRSGAIPGVFHGPLWLYLNVPAFIIGGGNPAFVAWFWVVLYIVSIFIIYYAGKKLFDEKTGLLSALLLSSCTVVSVRSLFNPYGALMLTPVFFYLFIKYLQNLKFKLLLLCMLTLGLIIQFQMAFGIPILVLTIIYLLVFLYRKQKIRHLMGLLILLIPLSSFIVFDIRNQFLQVKSVINYLTGAQNHGKEYVSFIQLIQLRAREASLGAFGEVTSAQVILSLAVLLLIVITFFQMYQKHKIKLVYWVFLYFYGGFWLISFLFQGPIWTYYYIPFVPLIILVFSSLGSVINQKVFYILFFTVIAFNLYSNSKEILSYQLSAENQDTATWKFNYKLAETVFKEKGDEFGYYIFTPDLYGYPPRYAMNYYQKTHSGKKSFPYEKKAVTYLLISPPPEYGRDPNSLWAQKNINSSSWKTGDIKISRQPCSSINYPNGFKIERYELSDDDLNIKSNPYLIQSIFFR